MSHKDTLTLYEELLSGGCPEAQAKIQAHQLGAFGDELSKSLDSIDCRLTSIDKEMMSLNKDMVWMRAIGAAMTLSFIGNAIFIACKG